MPTINHRRRKRQGERVITRSIDNSHIYNSKSWRKVRKAYLSDPAHALCVNCLLSERYTVANVLDHINPITQGGAIWDTNNWQPLCTTCHNQKSGKEAHSHITKGL